MNRPDWEGVQLDKGSRQDLGIQITRLRSAGFRIYNSQVEQ